MGIGRQKTIIHNYKRGLGLFSFCENFDIIHKRSEIMKI